MTEEKLFTINNNSGKCIEVSLAHRYSNQPLMYGKIYPNSNKKIKVQGDINNYELDISLKVTKKNETK